MNKCIVPEANGDSAIDFERYETDGEARKKKNALWCKAAAALLSVIISAVYLAFTGLNTEEACYVTKSGGEFEGSTSTWLSEYKRTIGSGARIIQFTPERFVSENAILALEATRGHTYRITVYLNNGICNSAELYDKTTNSYGCVTWEWKISESIPPGRYRVTVCDTDPDTPFFSETWLTVK